MDEKDKMKSRKLWALIGGIFTLAGGVMTGNLELIQAVTPGVALILGYFGANVAEKATRRGQQ